MTQALIKATQRFSETAIDDEVVLMSLADGTFFSLTETGAAIWHLIDGQRDRDAVLDALMAEYDVAAADAASALDAFLDQLLEVGFLA